MKPRRMSLGVSVIGAVAVAVLLQGCGTAAPRETSASQPISTISTDSAVTAEPAVTIVATAEPVTPSTADPTVAPTKSPTAEPTATVEPTTAPAVTLTPVLRSVVEGLEKPTYLTHAGDGSGLLYITEQPGRIRVLREGQLLDAPFLDITGRVGDSGNEQGLLSVAFAPDFAQSRKLYVNYTNTDGDTVVSGFIASDDGLTANPDSEWKVIGIAQPYPNHNGGQLKFGPDGMLYIGMGDGGSQGDPQNRAQNVDELLGKLLRLDVSKSTRAEPYAVPADNPNFGPGSRPEIWAVGLRNPWRFSFDRETGDLFIGDVGQNAIEEINFQPAAAMGGENYGWNLREGFEEYSGAPDDSFTEPIWQYHHGADGCSVTGGYVYRGATLPALIGAYVYGDFCSGKIWTLRTGTDGKWLNEDLFATNFSITSFGEDAVGELYVLDRGGTIYRLAGE